VTLDRYVVAEDCGRVINPAIVDGQVHSAVAQGIGAALYEDSLIRSARILLLHCVHRSDRPRKG
jgi:CO/xanthine dehydrogenase Mo-binding subunit